MCALLPFSIDSRLPCHGLSGSIHSEFTILDYQPRFLKSGRVSPRNSGTVILELAGETYLFDLG
jgi:hypothetical protein